MKFIYALFSIVIIATFAVAAPGSIDERSREIINKQSYFLNNPFPTGTSVEEMMKEIQKKDKYAHLYTPKEMDEWKSQLENKVSGIGVLVEDVDLDDDNNNNLKIIRIFENGSAFESGHLKVGDVIVAVNDKSIKTANMQDSVKMILGKEGTLVKLVVQRNNQRNTYFIERKEYRAEVTDSYTINNILYIKLDKFTRGSHDEVRDILNKNFLIGQTKAVILDLRYNPGGLLVEALHIANYFVDKGPLLTERDRTGKIIQEFNANGSFIKTRVIVLVNEGSASASEVVAGILRDRGVGILVGTKTYGKGSVQTMARIDNYVVKFTVARYFPPSGYLIDGNGLKPDYNVELREGERITTRLYEITPNEYDRQLRKAISIVD